MLVMFMPEGFSWGGMVFCFGLHCAAYCVGKMLEDIARQDWVNTVLEEAKTIATVSVSEPLVKVKAVKKLTAHNTIFSQY